MTASSLTDMTAISCPKCGGRCWDNRATKKNPKAPDYKCQNRACDGAIWPAKDTPKVPTGESFVLPVETKKPTMREAYKQLTDWVINEIGPIYNDFWGDDAFSPEVAAACTQTLFIQACKAGKVE